MEKEFRQWDMKTFSGKGYHLTPVEFKDVAPFDVKRMYYITRFEDGVQTGEHCHFVEEEVFLQAQGSTTMIIDRGNGKEEIAFSEGSVAYVPNYVWHGFKNASPDCVLIALSSTNYSPDRSDYLEDYEEYRKLLEEKGLMK